MADHDPMQPVGGSPLGSTDSVIGQGELDGLLGMGKPASIPDQDQIDAVLGFGPEPAAPNEALKAVYTRGKALRDPAGCGIGNQQSSEDYQRVEGGRSSEGNQPISAEEIAEMRRVHGAATPGDWCHRRDGKPEMNNQTDLIETTEGVLVAYGHLSAADAVLCVAAQRNMPRLLDVIEALTAENARLRKAVSKANEAADEAEGLRPLTPDEIASHSYLLTRANEGN